MGCPLSSEVFPRLKKIRFKRIIETEEGMAKFVQVLRK